MFMSHYATEVCKCPRYGFHEKGVVGTAVSGQYYGGLEAIGSRSFGHDEVPAPLPLVSHQEKRHIQQRPKTALQVD